MYWLIFFVFSRHYNLCFMNITLGKRELTLEDVSDRLKAVVTQTNTANIITLAVASISFIVSIAAVIIACCK